MTHYSSGMVTPIAHYSSGMVTLITHYSPGIVTLITARFTHPACSLQLLILTFTVPAYGIVGKSAVD